MSNQPKNNVHKDTPRPTSNKRVNIRWHPDQRGNRWGARSHRLPRFPLQTYLTDWGASSPKPCDSRMDNHGQKQPKRTFSQTFKHIQGTPLAPPPEGPEASSRSLEDPEPSKVLSRDNLRSHNEDREELRGSESDEESSSSKRSREEMEDGLEEEGEASGHQKRSRLGEGSKSLLVEAAHRHSSAGSDVTIKPEKYPESRSADKMMQGGEGIDKSRMGVRKAVNGCPHDSLSIQYNLGQFSDNNNNVDMSSAFVKEEKVVDGDHQLATNNGLKGTEQIKGSLEAVASGKEVSTKGKTVGSSFCNLNIQYNLGNGTQGRIEATPEKGAKAAKVFLAPNFRTEDGQSKETTDTKTESHGKTEATEMPTLPLQSDEPEVKEQQYWKKPVYSLKNTGVHRALQKQLQEKRKTETNHPGSNPKMPETDSTEDSEEEKEIWKKVVQSLTDEVKELEPVPSLSRQLRSTSPPLPPPVQPAFIHPWGLFPFGPMVASFPYGPCHPYWLQQQQRPYYPPYPQMGQPVPSGMQFPPPLLDDMSSSDGSEDYTNHDIRAQTHVRNGPSKETRQEGLLPTPDSHHYIPPAEKRIPLLEGEDGEHFEKQFPAVPSQHFPNYSSGQEHRMKEQKMLQRKHKRFTSDGEEEVDDVPTGFLNNAAGVKGIDATVQRPKRKIFVPGKLKQMGQGKSDLYGNLKTPEVPKKGGCGSIRILKRESSLSVCTPDTKEGSGEESTTVKKDADDTQPEDSDSDLEVLSTPRTWTGEQCVMGPTPQTAPAALSTLRMPFNEPHSYAACFGHPAGPSLSSPANHGFKADVHRGQLVARIQPRRRLTLQEEVMMEGIPKSLHYQFGLTARSSSPSFAHLEAGVVYPWSNVEYIDTHCHIDFLYQRLGCTGTFEKFGRVRGFPDNYGGCVAVFCTPESFDPSNPLWQNLLMEDKIWAAFGCHPHHVKSYDGVVETNILKGMMHNKAVAFGEIGLDYSNRNASDHILQHMVFKRQLALAMQLQKPLVIHSREAESDTLDIMVSMVPRDYKIHRHCFTGPPEEAREFMKAFPNSFIGLTNLVTFQGAVETHRTAQEIPLNRLLLETDAPYFLPKQCPREIRWSHPAMAVFVAHKVAQLRGITTDEVLRAVRKNTKEMYGI